MKQYDLLEEVKSAKEESLGVLVTRSGFRLNRHRKYRETMELLAPNGSSYTFTRIIKKKDMKDPKRGLIWICYLDEAIFLPEVGSIDQSVSLNHFLRCLLEQYVEFQDMAFAGHPISEIIWKVKPSI